MARRKQLARRASLDALLRFGPETDTLRAAIRQAAENRQTAIGQAHGQSAGVISAVDTARPEIKRVYRQAGLNAAQTSNTLIGHDLQGLSNVADSIVAGSALEQAAAAHGLQSDRSQALTDLSTRKVAAREGEQWAVQAAQQQFVKDLTNVLGQKKSLAQRIGAFKQSELDQLTQQDFTNRTARGNLNERTRHDKQTEAAAQRRIDAQAKGKSGSSFHATPTAYKDAHTQIGQALALLAQLDPSRNGKSRHSFRQLLINGHKSQPVYTTDATGKRVPALNADGTPKTTLDVPQIDQPYAVAAVQMYYDRHISNGLARQLRKLGFNINRLPVQKPPPKPKGAQQQAGFNLGNALGHLFG